jgi:5-formyltetrahydrofolate cyclo-ligase
MRVDEKQRLRAKLKKSRSAHVAGLPDEVHGLMFLRPPAPVAAAVSEGTVVGLYRATPTEAPTRRYAEWFYEHGRSLALPWFAERGDDMTFRMWLDPHDEGGLEAGPYGMMQPLANAPEVVPDTVFVPLLGFTADGHRVGQGGGHYDRWLAANPQVQTIGLAWDCQLVDSLPVEAHDVRLGAVVTPTRIYEGNN